MSRRVLWLSLSFLATCTILWFFWALGALPKTESSVMRLLVEHPQVEIRHAPQDAWAVVTGTVTLVPGDAVRTGPEGRATVQMFETSEHRLAGATEFVIDREGTSDWPGSSVIRLHVERGRVWSRVLRLLDLDSLVQIETNRVVATVRGTAFDFDAASTSTWIHVTHGAVTIFPKNTSSSVVAVEDDRVMFDSKGVQRTSFSTSSTEPISPWVQENTLKDEEFVTRIEAERGKRLMGLGEIHPDQLRDRLTLLSERLHLLLAGKEAPALYARYVTRRLYAVKKMIDGQMLGGASQALSMIEDSVARYIKDAPEHWGGAELLAAGMDEVALLVERTTPESPLYRLKQRLEDMRLAVFSICSEVFVETDCPASFLYTRLLTIEARLNETAVFVERGDLQAAAQEIEAAHQGILNMEPDVQEGATTGKVARLDRVALVEKLLALKAREESLRRMISLRSVMVPVSPVVSAPLSGTLLPSSTLPLVPTSTPPATTSSIPEVILVPSSTPPLPPAVATPPVATLVSVQMSPAISTLVSGVQTPLAAQAIYSDGTSKTVTSIARWTSSNLRLGFFVGPVFYASSPGTVTLVVSYTEGRIVKTASRDILITP